MKERCDARACVGQNACHTAADWMALYAPGVHWFPCEWIETEKVVNQLNALDELTAQAEELGLY